MNIMSSNTINMKSVPAKQPQTFETKPSGVSRKSTANQPPKFLKSTSPLVMAQQPSGPQQPAKPTTTSTKSIGSTTVISSSNLSLGKSDLDVDNNEDYTDILNENLKQLGLDFKLDEDGTTQAPRFLSNAPSSLAKPSTAAPNLSGAGSTVDNEGRNKNQIGSNIEQLLQEFRKELASIKSMDLYSPVKLNNPFPKSSNQPSAKLLEQPPLQHLQKPMKPKEEEEESFEAKLERLSARFSSQNDRKPATIAPKAVFQETPKQPQQTQQARPSAKATITQENKEKKEQKEEQQEEDFLNDDEFERSIQKLNKKAVSQIKSLSDSIHKIKTTSLTTSFGEVEDDMLVENNLRDEDEIMDEENQENNEREKEENLPEDEDDDVRMSNFEEENEESTADQILKKYQQKQEKAKEYQQQNNIPSDLNLRAQQLLEESAKLLNEENEEENQKNEGYDHKEAEYQENETENDQFGEEKTDNLENKENPENEEDNQEKDVDNQEKEVDNQENEEDIQDNEEDIQDNEDNYQKDEEQEPKSQKKVEKIDEKKEEKPLFFSKDPAATNALVKKLQVENIELRRDVSTLNSEISSLKEKMAGIEKNFDTILSILKEHTE